jgi:superoxide dismutase
MAFKLPDLPYDFSALEPHIDARTMEIHHGKHHATYVAKLNEALEKAPGWQNKTLEDIVRAYGEAPKEVQGALRNHGGGHFNHSLLKACCRLSRQQRVRKVIVPNQMKQGCLQSAKAEIKSPFKPGTG